MLAGNRIEATRRVFSLDLTEFFFRRPIPYPKRSIHASAGEQFSWWNEGDRKDLSPMSLELVQFPPRGRIPDANRSVFACRRHPPAIGRERDRENGTGVSAHDLDLLLRGQ